MKSTEVGESLSTTSTTVLFQRKSTYFKDNQTLAEVIRLVEKLNAAQQLTALLIPSMVSMMSNDDRCLVLDEWVILAATTLMCSVMAVINLDTLNRNDKTRFLPQEHHAIKADLIAASIYPHPKGKITLHPLWSPTWETFQSITISPPFPLKEEQQFQKALIIILIQLPQQFALPFGQWNPHNYLYQNTSNQHSHTPSCTFHFSLQMSLMPTIPQTGASITPATPTTLHRKHSQEKPSHVQDFQPPKTPSSQDSHHPGFPFRFFLRFRQLLWPFKIIEPSPSSDEDKWGWQSSNTHYTIGLVSDCLQ